MINRHSNKYNPYGWYDSPTPRSWENDPFIRFNNYAPSSYLQKKIEKLSKECCCCQRNFENCVTINFFHCTDCVEHTSCCNCNKSFTPSASSFLRYCQDCWVFTKLHFTKDVEFKNAINYCMNQHCPCKFSKGKDKNIETDRNSDPVIA